MVQAGASVRWTQRGAQLASPQMRFAHPFAEPGNHILRHPSAAVFVAGPQRLLDILYERLATLGKDDVGKGAAAIDTAKLVVRRPNHIIALTGERIERSAVDDGDVAPGVRYRA